MATVYPNPFKDYISITGIDSFPAQIVISDGKCALLSKTVLQGKETLSIDVSTLKRGLYFITIKTKLGNKTQKVVKE
jgi:hypothetical protein